MVFTVDIELLRSRAASSATPASAASPLAGVEPCDLDGDPFASFSGHYATLLGVGLDEQSAFDIAEAVCFEHQAGGERRVCSLECRQYRRGYCMSPRAAGMPAQLGELAFMPQRCAAFEPHRQDQ